MSFYHLPHPYNPQYAIPDYVMAEPPERGTFTTKWLPRGTISQVVPDFLAKPGKTLLGRNDAGLGSLGDDTLDAVTTAPPVATPPTTPAPSSSLPGWVVPVALVGAAYLLLGKKKRRR